MSDNNVCPKCGAERNTAGLIVHAANCPNITTTNWTSPIHYIFPNTVTIDEREYHFLQSEIARLKAELEKAIGGKVRLVQHFINERDEARRKAGTEACEASREEGRVKRQAQAFICTRALTKPRDRDCDAVYTASHFYVTISS